MAGPGPGRVRGEASEALTLGENFRKVPKNSVIKITFKYFKTSK